MTFKVYIPARYASTRLPGKALLEVDGKPILQHVYERALASGALEVVIATDDERIVEAALSFGAIVEMTSDAHQSGTDRIAEAVDNRAEKDATIIVNLQGDEPQMPSAVIQQVAATLGASKDVDIATVCEPIEERSMVTDPNVVKVVRGANDRALYFSRAPIPYERDRPGTLAPYRRHVGIYGYRVSYLRKFVLLPAGQLEQLERLEQLRALATNAVIAAPDAVATCGVGVDTPEDLQRLLLEWGS